MTWNGLMMAGVWSATKRSGGSHVAQTPRFRACAASVSEPAAATSGRNLPRSSFSQPGFRR
jgi:hypothetical protein